MQQIPSPGTKNNQDAANTFGIPFSCLPKRRWPADRMSSAAGLGAFRGEVLHEYRSAWTRGDLAAALQAAQCTLLAEASPAKPRGLAVWDGGQFRQVLSLEESSLRPLGSLSSHSPFFSPEQLLIGGSHPWSEQLHCSCAQSWPLYPGDLHLKPHPLSWLPSLTMDLPHHCDHPTLSVSAWLPRPSTDRSYRWCAALTCLLDLGPAMLLWACLAVWTLGWSCYHETCSACHVQVLQDGTLVGEDTVSVCVYHAQLLAPLPAETCDAGFCLLQRLKPPHLWADSEKQDEMLVVRE